MTIEVQTLKDKNGNEVILFKLFGDLDAFSSKDFKTMVIDFAEKGYSRYIVDLSGTPFIDSSGLVALISLLKRAKLMGGYLRLVGVHQSIKDIFSITGLNKVFEFYDTVEEALNAD